MTDHPLISIVINNFNYGEFLRRTIDSALQQSYPHVEVVVVDDGSTDDSREIVASYGERLIAVLGENRGQGAAYNSGFRASRGDIVIFLDSDDVLYPEAAGAIARAWRPGTAKVQFRLETINIAGEPLGFSEPNLPFAPGEELKMLLHYGYYPTPPGSGNAYARSMLERIMPLDEATWRVGSDGVVIGLAPLFGSIVSIERPLGAYRHHGRNHSEASGTNLAKIRRDLLNEVNREIAIKRHAAALGRRVERALSLSIPGHCKGRILSLRLDPENHPFQADGSVGLALAGIAASWQFPHHSTGKRIAATIAFAMMPFVPRNWLARRLDAIIIARRRSALLRRLLPLQATSEAVAPPQAAWRGVAAANPVPVRSRESS